MKRQAHFAYVVYWGAVEPVGLATAVPTVLGLAKEARLTLVSFEKSEDQANRAALEATSRRLVEAGVRWTPLPYSPGVGGTPRDIWKGVSALRRIHRVDPFQAIEGRTFVGGFVAALASRLLRIPFLYHPEGCWLDEQVDVGRLRRGSPMLRALRAIESWTMRQAGACVALTEVGASHIRERHLTNRPEVPVLVIPTTSVHVGKSPSAGLARRIRPGEPVKAVYAGSVTGRYLLDEMLAFFKELLAERPGSVIDLLTHRDRDVAEAAVAKHCLQEVVTLDSVTHYEIPARLEGRDVGFLFWDRGDAVPCMSPTKIPEYLELGIPVICTRASGDGASVLDRARVGVIIEDPRDLEERKQALRKLDRMLLDTERSTRAQRMAREHYSLGKAVQRQLSALFSLAQRHV